jgi:hypothetical protein
MPIGGNECQIENSRRSREQPIGRVIVRQLNFSAGQGCLKGQRSFVNRQHGERGSDPCLRIDAENDSSLLAERQDFPHAYRGNPQFVLWVRQHACDSAPQAQRFSLDP